MIFRRRLLASLLFLVAAAGTGWSRVAFAQDAKPGRVTSRAFHPVVARTMIEVSPLDDRPENLAIATALRDELSRAGYLLGDATAPLRLSFDSEVRAAPGPVRQSPDQPAGRGNAAGDEPNSPLPDRPVRRGSDGASRRPAPALRYVVNATLDDRATGKRLWQGNVRYDDAEGDRARVLVRLAVTLMAVFGKSEKGRSFALE